MKRYRKWLRKLRRIRKAMQRENRFEERYKRTIENFFLFLRDIVVCGYETVTIVDLLAKEINLIYNLVL